MEQLHRTKVDVQIELEPESQQNVAGVLVPRHSGVAKGAEEDRIDAVPEPVKGRVGQRFPRLEIMIRGVRQAFPLDREAVLSGHAIENRDRSLDDFRPDAVTRDDRDRELLHSNPVGRPHARQYAQPTSSSLLQPGHFSSPSRGCPQCGQKRASRFAGNTPPQYSH